MTCSAASSLEPSILLMFQKLEDIGLSLEVIEASQQSQNSVLLNQTKSDQAHRESSVQFET